MNQSVLCLVPDLLGPPGGIARYSRMACRALLESGYRVAVVALQDAVQATPQAHVQFPGMSYQPCRGDRWEFARKTMLAALRDCPKVILLTHANLTPLGWPLARLIGSQVLTVIHGIEVWQPRTPLRRLALQRSDRILSVSHFTARKAEQLNGVSSQRVRILYNCLEPKFELRANQTKATSNLSLLTVSRIIQDNQKGHEYVIRAMPILLNQFPELIYHIVGDGDGRPALEALAKQEGVAQAVHFCGSVSDEELIHLYADASLFVMPSRGEGFGYVFIEAMAQGTPAIGGNIDATPEVIVDGETGYLVDPTSVDAIVAAAARLLGDPDLRARMGQAAMRHVAQEFSYNQFRARLISYLSELQPAATTQTRSD